MTDKINEQLSALADDELAPSEMPLLWQRMARDPAVRARWGRYHLIGDALRDSLPSTLQRGFAERITDAVAVEAPQPARNPWLRRAGGIAVAASVMVAALVTLRFDEAPTGPEPAVVTPATANPQGPASVRFASSQGLQWEHARPEVQSELSEYLMTHSDAAVQDNGEDVR